MDDVKTIQEDNNNKDEEITFVGVVNGIGQIAKAVGSFTDEILAVFK